MKNILKRICLTALIAVVGCLGLYGGAISAKAAETAMPRVVDFSQDVGEEFIPYYISNGNNGVQEELSSHWQQDKENKQLKRINDVGKADVTSQYAALYYKGISLRYFELSFTVKLGSEAGLVGVVFGSSSMGTRHLGSGNALYLLPDSKLEVTGSTLGGAKTSRQIPSPAGGSYEINLKVYEGKVQATTNGVTLNLTYPTELIQQGRIALFTANTGATFVGETELYALNAAGERTAMSQQVLVEGVAFERSTVTIKMSDEPLLLDVEIQPANATEKGIVWISEIPDIAVVDNDGYLHPLKQGTTAIYAVSVDGSFRDDITVHVVDSEILVEGISLDKTEYTGKVGEQFYLIPTITPVDADEQGVRWQSSNTAVAMVNSGTITLIGEGECIITVRDESGDFSATCKITVLAKDKQSNTAGCSAFVAGSGVWIAAALVGVAVAIKRREVL